MASRSVPCEAVTEQKREEERGEIPVLKLSLKKEEKKKKIQWTKETVDNEGLGRKKSKCCCQFKKPRSRLDESSSESEEEDCENCPGH